MAYNIQLYPGTHKRDSFAKKSANVLISYFLLVLDSIDFVTISLLNIVINTSEIGVIDAIFHEESNYMGFINPTE